MERDSKIYKTYVEILKRELVPAMGCTEPIAIAFATAKATAVLGTLPEKILVETSGNIIKNVKSVVVPNTNGKRGIATAAAAGAVFGDADAGLQVIAKSSEEDQKKLDEYLKRTEITVKGIDHGYILDIIITVSKISVISKKTEKCSSTSRLLRKPRTVCSIMIFWILKRLWTLRKPANYRMSVRCSSSRSSTMLPFPMKD